MMPIIRVKHYEQTSFQNFRSAVNFCLVVLQKFSDVLDVMKETEPLFTTEVNEGPDVRDQSEETSKRSN